jgi:outer membrane lipoprotein-sorting protein
MKPLAHFVIGVPSPFPIIVRLSMGGIHRAAIQISKDGGVSRPPSGAGAAVPPPDRALDNFRPPWFDRPMPTTSRASRPARAALLMVLSLAACVRRAPPPDLSPDPAALLQQVEVAQARVQRVRGEAKVRVESKEGGGAVTQFVAAERPDRLRLDVLDFFGNPAAVLVADGGRFSLLDLRENVFLRGRATPANLARIVPLPIPASELVTILCGTAPLPGGRPVGVEPGDGVLELSIERDGALQRLEIGPGAAVVASRQEPRFAEGGGGPFPREVTLDARGSRVLLRLRWKEIEVNGVLPPETFTLAPPSGARIVDLDAE